MKKLLLYLLLTVGALAQNVGAGQVAIFGPSGAPAPGTAVTSLTGTEGEVLANDTSGSPQTGAVTVSLPNAITGVNSITAEASSAFTLNGGAGNTNVVLSPVGTGVVSSAFPIISTNDASFRTWQGSSGFDARGLNVQRSAASPSAAINLLHMAGLAQFNAQVANGSFGSPTIVTNGNGFQFRMMGYNGASFSPQAGINITATDNWTATTSYPTRIRMSATPAGSTSSADVLDLYGNYAEFMQPTRMGVTPAATGHQIYNTADQVTNYTRAEWLWSSNVAILRTTNGGSGTARQLRIQSATGGVDLVGTASNDSAATGSVGQYVESLVPVGSAVSLTTATPANVTSISLTAGDWDVSASVNFVFTTTTTTVSSSGVSSTSGALPTDGTEVANGYRLDASSGTTGNGLPRKRFSLNATTTVYLVASATFTGGTATAYGAITARRVR